MRESAKRNNEYVEQLICSDVCSNCYSGFDERSESVLLELDFFSL